MDQRARGQADFRVNRDHWSALTCQLGLALSHGSGGRFPRMYAWVDRAQASNPGQDLDPRARLVVSIPTCELEDGFTVPAAGLGETVLVRAGVTEGYLDLEYRVDRTESVDQVAGWMLVDILGLKARPGEPEPLPRWCEEFGPVYRCPPLPEGFEDFSWHNDAMPSFGFWDETKGEASVRLWIDHPDPEERVGGGGARFVVSSSSQKHEDPFEEGEWEQAVACARELQRRLVEGIPVGAGSLRAAVREDGVGEEAEIARLNGVIDDWVGCGNAIMKVAVGREAPLSDSDVIRVIEGQRTTIGSLLGLVGALRHELLLNSSKDFAEFMAMGLADAHRFPEVSRHLQTFSWAAEQIDETLKGVRFQLPRGEALEALIGRGPQGGGGLNASDRAREILRALGESQEG